MRTKITIYAFLNTLLCATITAKSIAKEEEVEVKLQFLEYELEDFCNLKNEAEWRFLNGSVTDLKKFLDVELKESEFYKNELAVLQKHMGKEFSHEKLQRLMDVFSHPGAPLLGNMEFKEYRDYSVKLQELIGTMKIECNKECNENLPNTNSTSNSTFSKTEEISFINRRKMNEILFLEKNEKKLKDIWIKWYRELEEKNKKTKYDFVQQLSILDLEAEQNGYGAPHADLMDTYYFQLRVKLIGFLSDGGHPVEIDNLNYHFRKLGNNMKFIIFVGEEDLTEYWLKQSDLNLINFDTVKTLWTEISPLYEKLKQYMTSLIMQNFGRNVFHDKKLLPGHFMGSLETHDWVTAAEKLGAFDHSDTYKALKFSLKQKKSRDLYKMADNLTAELKLGFLPQSFYEKSRFNESSQFCQNKRMRYCEREAVPRIMFCKEEVNLKHYIAINEEVMKMKHLLLSGKEEEDNGYLFREGPRDSVLHEAMGGFSSLRALWPEILQNQKLLPNETQQKQEILSLFITALHVIPPLPYYIVSDAWRINALQEIDAAIGENTADSIASSSTFSTPHNLEKRRALNDIASEITNTNNDNDSYVEEPLSNYNVSGESNDVPKTYDTRNLTRDWWKYRAEYQGIGSPDGNLYEDYLQDDKIIWNKPYLSKFLGTVLQFQILEYLKTENLTTDTLSLLTLMQQGKSKPWQILAEETFNITEISTKPLLKYFNKLEEFLDKKIKMKNHTRIFSLDDFNFISQGFSLNPVNDEGEEEGEKPAEGSDALFFSSAVIAAVGVVAIIVTVGRRRYRRRQRDRERKRRMAEL